MHGLKLLFWKWVKEQDREEIIEVTGIMNKNNDMEWDECKMIKCWKAYFEDLYGNGRLQMISINLTV